MSFRNLGCRFDSYWGHTAMNVPESTRYLSEINTTLKGTAAERLCKRYLRERIQIIYQEQQLPFERLVAALKGLEGFKYFPNSKELLKHLYAQEKLSLPKKIKDTFAVALLTLSTAAFAVSVVDDDQNVETITLMPGSALLNKRELLGHELEHVADTLLGLISAQDRKRGVRLLKLSLGYTLVSFLPLLSRASEINGNFDQFSQLQQTVVEGGVLAIGILGVGITQRLYNQLPHEQRAHQAANRIKALFNPLTH